jgi:hypothetical protein
MDYGLLSGFGCVVMDNVATFIKSATKTDAIAKVRMELYTEILIADRTGKSLMAQGFSRSDIQYSMQVLVKEGLVFKYGVGVNTYYSVTKNESQERSKRLDPVVIPEQYVGNLKLGFRMGYTDIPPGKGKVFKGALSVYEKS